MSKQLTIAKIIAVPGIDTLSFDVYKSHYYPYYDIYLFWSEAEYDADTNQYLGILRLHDWIARKYDLDLRNDQLNHVSVDIKPSDKLHTYLKVNKREHPLTQYQKELICGIFDVDFVS